MSTEGDGLAPPIQVADGLRSSLRCGPRYAAVLALPTCTGISGTLGGEPIAETIPHEKMSPSLYTSMQATSLFQTFPPSSNNDADPCLATIAIDALGAIGSEGDRRWKGR
jgi:hypothetical protein